MHIQSINFLTSNSIEERKFPEQLDIHMEKKKKKPKTRIPLTSLIHVFNFKKRIIDLNVKAKKLYLIDKM